MYSKQQIIIALALIAVILLSIVCYKSSKKEGYGGYITPTEVMGAVRQGSTTTFGAVEIQNPREECLRRCLGALQNTADIDETYADERKQMCYGMC
jgi:hypothetical protein